ncbi:Protein H2A.6 [Bienertia sinuspersici]
MDKEVEFVATLRKMQFFKSFKNDIAKNLNQRRGWKRRTCAKKAIRQPVKAALQFPVNRVGRHLKKGCYAQCISSIAPVYLAVVLEYLAFKVLEFVGNAAVDNKKKRIIPRHLIYLSVTLFYARFLRKRLKGVNEKTMAVDNKKKRIILRQLMLAVKGDEELDKLFQGVTIAQGGVMPYIHAPLFLDKIKTSLEKVAASPVQPTKSPKKA